MRALCRVTSYCGGCVVVVLGGTVFPVLPAFPGCVLWLFIVPDGLVVFPGVVGVVVVSGSVPGVVVPGVVVLGDVVVVPGAGIVPGAALGDVDGTVVEPGFVGVCGYCWLCALAIPAKPQSTMVAASR